MQRMIRREIATDERVKAMRTIRDEDSDDEGDVTIGDVCAVAETELALQCEIDGVQHWIPKSVITDDSEVFDAEDNDSGKLVLKGWFARREGFGE